MYDIHDAIKLREEGNVSEALSVLQVLLSDDPENPDLNYQMAWCNDILENEQAAIPYYRAAIANGLNAADLKNAFLGLGSTCRAVGDYESARAVLQQAAERFPDVAVYKIFLAMTLYNTQEYDKSMELILRTLVDTTKDDSILEYKRAILFYSDKLNVTYQ